LVGFVDSVNSQGVAQVYLVRHIGEWISGMEHLTAARERNATRVSIYTKPNSTQRMCLDVPWGSPYQHTPVNQYPCHYGPAQVFYLDWKGSSDATLIAASSGKCIDVPSGTSNSGQNLQIYTCHDGPNQRWDFDFHSSGSGWRIYPLSASSRCLSVEGGASTQSRVTEQRTCIGSSDQRWYLQF
ncbi:MAG: RICIN domain-containing protein, partial [Myxococcota bacterium]